jgi:hypothetical protein
MGHTRLGRIPTTRKWNEVISLVAGTQGTTSSFEISSITSRTLDAAQGALDKSVDDPGVRYTFYLLTQIALASRKDNWEAALAEHGLRVANAHTVFDFTAEVQNAIDRYVRQSSRGATDISEMAQQAAGETLLSLSRAHSHSLFGESSEDVREMMRALSTKKGFGELGQRFFGRFVARFLNFYLSRITAAQIGTKRIQDAGDFSRFEDSLKLHCDQSARIVPDFCGAWYSKTEYKQGIDLENTSGFLAVATQKLRAELEQQKAAR